MNRVVRANQKLGADLGQFVSGREHQVAYPIPVRAVNAFHVRRERMGVHRNFGMIVRTHELRAFGAYGAVAKRGPLGGASNDSNVLRHNFRSYFLLCRGRSR